MHVVQRFQDLFEVKSTQSFIHRIFTHHDDLLEISWSFNELSKEVAHLLIDNLGTIQLGQSNVILEIVVFDQVVMLKFLSRFVFRPQNFVGLLFFPRIADLNGF